MTWPTTLTPVALDRLAPWLTPATDPTGDHATYISALAAMGEQVWQLVMDYGDPDDPDYTPGWGALFDVDLVPTQFIPFLAQFVGVQIPAGTDDATARQMVRAEQGFQRGTVAAMTNAALRNLTTDFLVFQQRTALDGSEDAWSIVLGYRTADLLTTAQDLMNAVLAVKPAGIIINFVGSTGFLWDEAINDFSTDTGDWPFYFANQP